MSDNGVADDISPTSVHIKKEIEMSFSKCSPSNSEMYSPTTTVMHDTNVSISIKKF